MKKICKVEGCLKPHKGLGYCLKHYQRYKRHGDPLYTPKKGVSRSSEYASWIAMLHRCYDPKRDSFPNYGGRGITVCIRWQTSFEYFLEDMGPKPFPKAQIDRKKTNGNYDPGNCRWLSNAENSRNRRTTILNWPTVRVIRKLHKAKLHSVNELCKIFNLKKTTLESVIYNQKWKEE